MLLTEYAGAARMSRPEREHRRGGIFGAVRFGAAALVLFPVVAKILTGSPAWAEPSQIEPPEQRLTLSQCIELALLNNRYLAAGRLDRLAQQLSLEDAEDEFSLRPDIGMSMDRDWGATNADGSPASTFDVSPRVMLRMPTGGSIGLTGHRMATNQDGESGFVQLNFVQPLLRGGGTTVGTADLATARRVERMGVLGFEAVVTDLVTRTVYAYRNVMRTMRSVEIAEISLQRAQELLEVNRVLIETGRMAERDIVQTEANVAERELGLAEAIHSLDDAHLALMDILDMNTQIRLRPAEELRVEPFHVDAESAVELALRRRPDYLQAMLAIENERTALAVAANARKWNLDLVASARSETSGSPPSEASDSFEDDYRVGLNLNIPLGVNASDRRRNHERARISLRRSEVLLAELRQSIDLDVRARVREIEIQFRRAELARDARVLAERKIETERTKLNFGLTTNFQVVQFEDDLVRSQNVEIGATITYLNALTALDRTQGTTLDTWRIEIGLLTDGAPE